MKSIFLIIWGLSTFAIPLCAQTITGKVIDEQSQAVEFASVALYSLSDSTLITGTVTNVEGVFSLNAPANVQNQFLKISFVGYETQTTTPQTEQTIMLKTDTKMLGEVVVKGVRKAFTMNNGNIVANVSGTVLEKEVNALEVLRKVPGMTLKDGQLSSFIGGTPIIYINGKKTQSMAEVQQLEVKNIKSVELNTNPGAEYDASTGAVLLITTYKRLEGLAVQVENTVRKNHFWSHENAVKVNFNKNKVNVFGQLSYSDWRRKTSQDVTTKIFVPDTTWVNKVAFDGFNYYKTLSYSLGMDYSISENHSIGVKYDGETNKYTSFDNQPLKLWANDKLISEIEGNSEKKDKGNRHYINGYYRGNVTDRFQMELFADYLTKHSNDNQLVGEKSKEYGSNETKINTISDNSLFAVNPKFNFTLNEQHRFSAGAEYSTSNVQTTLNYQPQKFTDTRSENSENRWAGYLSYNFKNGNGFGLNAGLRYEWVNSRYDDLENDKNDIHRTYGDWFPNLQLSYQKGLWSQSLNYRSGISRPSYNTLNGNTFYVNQFMYQEGNPKLVPEISHNFQYNLMYRFVYLSLRYGCYKNAIKNDFQTSSPTSNVVKSTYKNYDKTEQIQALLNLRHTFGVYTPSLTLAYMQNFMTVPVNSGLELINRPFGYINFNNDINLSNGFLFNAEYSYTGRGTAGFFLFEPTHTFNARVQKTFWNDKLQVSLTANDIFGKQIGRFSGQVNHIYMYNIDNQDRRSLTLNVIWRFNNYKKTYKGQSASQDEINRL